MSFEYKYCNQTILKRIILEGTGFLSKETLYIIAIGDLLVETEYHKEQLTPEQYKQVFENICSTTYNDPKYFIQEVTKSELNENMFVEEDGDYFIDEEVNKSHLPTHYTINYIALKPCVELNFWDHDILANMKEFYNG